MGYRWCILLALVGCQSNSPSPPNTGSGSADGTRLVAISPDPPPAHRTSDPAVELPYLRTFAVLEPGAEPRTALRYQLAPEARTYLATTKLRTRQRAGGKWNDSTDMPPVVSGIAITPGTAGAAATGRILPGAIEGTATPAATEYLAAWDAMAGRRVAFTLDDRGILSRAAFADDPGAQRSAQERDDVLQRYLAAIVPVPEEPVGVGAKWRVVTMLRQAPTTVKQTATYTLDKIDASGWTISVEVRRYADQQRLLLPSVPPDVQLDLIALLRVFTGTLRVDPRYVIGTGTLAVQSTIHIRAKRAGELVQSEELTEDTGTIQLASEPVKP